MLDGIYFNPTKIIFGRGAEAQVGKEIKKYSDNIILHYGGGSIKRYGLYDRVTESLKAEGVKYCELGGVKSNPTAELVYKGIALCRREKIDFILAVGGGSVIDSAKAISIGVPWNRDFFDFLEQKAVPEKALRLGTILTVAGSGSESSTSAVITHEAKKLKRSCDTPLLAPVFSMLNPELTLTVSAFHTACGVADAISHILERYFSNTAFVDCTDRICEGLLKTLMKYGLLVRETPESYDVRAEIMWACKLAQDNSAGFGRKQDWAVHKIAHELGALYDVAHGAALAVLFPAWMKYVHHSNPVRFEQFAERVFDIEAGRAGAGEAAIEKLTAFFRSIGMPSTLRELGIGGRTDFAAMAEKCVKYMASGTVGNFVRLGPQDIIKILELAY